MQAEGQRRAGIYCRISKHDPSVPKVEVQEDQCRALAQACGYSVRTVYVDDGISASKFRNRPGWQQLLADISGGLLDVVLAVEEERFTRQPMEKETLALACVSAGVTWHTVRGGPIDPSTAEGEFLSGLTGILARREVRRKAERQRSSNTARRLRGEPLAGVRPFGFERDRITHREEEVSELRWAYETTLSGGTLYSIVRVWNSRGIKTTRGNGWTYTTIRQLLKRPSNAGLVESDGAILDVPAVWEPIVSRETWESVCAILSDPARRTSATQAPRWLCAGIACCGACGEVMRSGTGSDRRATFTVYRCTHREPGRLDGLRHATVKTGQLDAAVRDAVVTALLFGPTDSVAGQDVDLADLRRDEARLREVHQALLDLADLIGRAGFSRATTAKRGAELDAEREQLEASIQTHLSRSAHAAMLADASATLWAGPTVSIQGAADVKGKLAVRFDNLQLHQRRTLVRSLLRVTVHPGRRPDRIEIEHRSTTQLNDTDES